MPRRLYGSLNFMLTVDALVSPNFSAVTPDRIGCAVGNEGIAAAFFAATGQCKSLFEMGKGPRHRSRSNFPNLILRKVGGKFQLDVSPLLKALWICWI